MAKIEFQGSPSMTLEEVFKLSDKVLEETYGKELVPGFSSEVFATPILNFDNDEDYRNYIYSLKIDELQKKYLFELNDIMFQYSGTNLCYVIESITKFENELLGKYESKELENVLVSSSVGRFSLAYWDNRVNASLGETAKKGFWKKLFTGVADALGAAGGAVAGSATVVGGIAGGVAGGIAVSTGFAKVWDIFAE